MMHFMMWGFWLVVLGLLIVGVVLLARQGQEPASPTGATTRSPPTAPPTAGQRRLSEGELSLLDPGERQIYELVASNGGDTYQKDLPDLTGFSKAKVSRLLDKLERKQLVVRVSHGMTNRVVLAPGTRS